MLSQALSPFGPTVSFQLLVYRRLLLGNFSQLLAQAFILSFQFCALLLQGSNAVFFSLLSGNALDSQFLDFAASVDGIKPKGNEWEITAPYMKPQIKALVGRYSKLGEEAFYLFYLPIDDTIQAALSHSSVVE